MTPPLFQPEVRFAAFTPDGALLVTASRYGQLRIWDAETGSPLGERSANQKLGLPIANQIDGMAIMADSRRIRLIQGREIQSWDIPLEQRSQSELEALSLVLSGHEIDSGEGLAPVTADRVEAARTFLLRRNPMFFKPPPPP
jgi:WD40 repeat protein